MSLKITSNTINYNVATVEELSTIAKPSINATVVVTDENRGGVFIYRSTGVANGGTIFDSSSTGKWYRQYDGAVNVKWFGAKGDGITDDTVAIQNTINSSYDVYLPRNSYLITSSLTLPSEGGDRKKPIYLYGDAGNVLIESTNATTLIYNGVGSCIDGVNSDTARRSIIHMENIVFTSSNKTAGTIAINLQKPTGTKLHNIGVSNFDIGIKTVDGSWYANFSSLKIDSCTIGLKIENAANGMNIFNCAIGGCDYAVNTSYSGEQINFNNCIFESNNINSFKADYFRQLNISNCYFEENINSSSSIFATKEDARDSQLNLTNCSFYNASTTATSIIYVNNSTNADFKVNASGIYTNTNVSSSVSTFLVSNSTSTNLYIPTAIQQYEDTGSKIINIATTAVKKFYADDYSEGTWVPIIKLGTATEHTYTTQVGTYTKIGRSITAYFDVRITAKNGSSANDFSITGLPFTASSQLAGVNWAQVFGITLSAPYTSIIGHSFNNSIRLLRVSNGSYDIIKNSEVGSSVTLNGSITFDI
ncbi:MAG: glycosyl hydrolase family 28-related protein [Desulfuromonadaceae bacterium]|nr:glycosyl hydrolase family 28-related protein [Desulfuromonadaceae bacterium]